MRATRNRVTLVAAVYVLLGWTWASSATGQAPNDVWHLDPAHTAAHFAVRHLGISTVRGTFSKVSGEVKYSPSSPTQASVEVTIDAASIDTGVAMRDNDVRGAHFLEVAKYPTMTFKSKAVEAGGAGKLRVTGDLTLHGVTKEVVLDVEGPSAPVKAMGGTHLGASATTKIMRSDFGMTAMQGMIGDEIDIVIDADLVDRLMGPPPGQGRPPQGPPPAQ